MLKRNFIPFILIFILFYAFNVNAQDRVIHGSVTAFDSIPLIGASVTVKSTKQVVLTDSDGKFSIPCTAKDIIWIKARGFNTRKIKLNSQIKFAAVNLSIKPGEKNRMYAVGYGKVSDRDRINALASVSKEEIDFSNYANISEIIASRFPGVQILNGTVVMRGSVSIWANPAALIVVDGIIVDGSILNSIPTNQVKNINIIKDGSAAIYGTRGANGVVLIETKTGDD